MMCEACGQRRVIVFVSPVRNPRSRAARNRKGIALKDHTLCCRCWRRLWQPVFVAQREAYLDSKQAWQRAVRGRADRVA